MKPNHIHNWSSKVHGPIDFSPIEKQNNMTVDSSHNAVKQKIFDTHACARCFWYSPNLLTISYYAHTPPNSPASPCPRTKSEIIFHVFTPKTHLLCSVKSYQRYYSLGFLRHICTLWMERQWTVDQISKCILLRGIFHPSLAHVLYVVLTKWSRVTQPEWLAKLACVILISYPRVLWCWRNAQGAVFDIMISPHSPMMLLVKRILPFVSCTYPRSWPSFAIPVENWIKTSLMCKLQGVNFNSSFIFCLVLHSNIRHFSKCYQMRKFAGSCSTDHKCVLVNFWIELNMVTSF